jgi:hypothetical protein
MSSLQEDTGANSVSLNIDVSILERGKLIRQPPNSTSHPIVRALSLS